MGDEYIIKSVMSNVWQLNYILNCVSIWFSLKLAHYFSFSALRIAYYFDSILTTWWQPIVSNSWLVFHNGNYNLFLLYQYILFNVWQLNHNLINKLYKRQFWIFGRKPSGYIIIIAYQSHSLFVAIVYWLGLRWSVVWWKITHPPPSLF